MKNLKNINNETYKKMIEVLIGTDNEMEFINFNDNHENIALHIGLTVLNCGDRLIIKDEPCDINFWA
jgi:hypothetical protein